MMDYCTSCIFCTRTSKTEFTISIYLYLQSIPVRTVRTILCYIYTNNNGVYSIFVFLCFGLLCILLLLLFFIVGFQVPDVVELASRTLQSFREH